MVALTTLFASFALAAPAVIAGRVVARANLVARQLDGASPEIPSACVDTCTVFTQTFTGDCADESCLCTQTIATGIADCLRCAVKYVNTPDFNESVATTSINGFISQCNAAGFPITLDGFTATSVTGIATATSDAANSTSGSATATSTTLSTSGTTSQTATRSTSTSSKVTESQTAPGTTGTTQSSAGAAHTVSVMGSVAVAAMAGFVLL